MKYRIAAIILCSIAMTIAGAWIPAVWLDLPWIRPRQETTGFTFLAEDHEGPRKWVATFIQQLGREDVGIRATRGVKAQAAVDRMGRSEFEFSTYDSVLPRWAFDRVPHPGDTGEKSLEMEFTLVASGIPFRAMWYRLGHRVHEPSWARPPRTLCENSGIRISPILRPGGAQVHRALPLQILWPGFLANTAIFAVTMSLFFFVPGMLIRRRRRKRNRCVKCNYDLRGADHARCPECGYGLTVVEG